MHKLVLGSRLVRPTIGGARVDRTFNISGSDWQVKHEDVDEIKNFVVQRAGGQHFHVTMVDDPAGFRQALILEHDQGHDKVGDVVIQLRRHPETGRYMVQVDQETVFESETRTRRIYRAIRSSVDNIAQAVKKTVVHSGWVYSNPRRIGGKPIKTHYVLANWSPQLADQMMDVYEFVQQMDSLGLATFLKALQHMPESPARAIFRQIRQPAG